MGNAAEVIRMARELQSGFQVLARAHICAISPDLTNAGADRVFTGEGEVALSADRKRSSTGLGRRPNKSIASATARIASSSAKQTADTHVKGVTR